MPKEQTLICHCDKGVDDEENDVYAYFINIKVSINFDNT